MRHLFLIYIFVCGLCVWITSPKLYKKRFKKMQHKVEWKLLVHIWSSVPWDAILSCLQCTPRRKAFIPEGKNNSKMNIIKKRLLAVVVWGGKWAFHIVELWTPGGDAWWIRRDGCRDRNVVPYLVSRQDYLIYPQIMYIYSKRYFCKDTTKWH